LLRKTICDEVFLWHVKLKFMQRYKKFSPAVGVYVFSSVPIIMMTAVQSKGSGSYGGALMGAYKRLADKQEFQTR
jgi:hypothetical protein